MNAIETSICALSAVLSFRLPQDASFMEVLRASQEAVVLREAMEIAKDIVSNMDIEYILPSRKELKRAIECFGDVISYSYSEKSCLRDILKNLNVQEIKDMVDEFEFY